MMPGRPLAQLVQQLFGNVLDREIGHGGMAPFRIHWRHLGATPPIRQPQPERARLARAGYPIEAAFSPSLADRCAPAGDGFATGTPPAPLPASSGVVVVAP